MDIGTHRKQRRQSISTVSYQNIDLSKTQRTQQQSSKNNTRVFTDVSCDCDV